MNKLIGIYKIQSTIHPERFYIGSSINITKRWYNHIFKLDLNKHNPKLQNHYNKYGLNDLQFSIILYGCRKEDLLFLEQIFINNYKPWFNCCPTAGNSLGRIPWNKGLTKNTSKILKEQGELHSKKMTGRKQSDITKERHRVASIKAGCKPPNIIGMKLPPKTEEQKQRIRDWWVEEKIRRINKKEKELKELFPQFVLGEDDEMLSVNYSELVSICIKAIQELKQEINELKND